jgi:hypothetical protein
MKLDSLEYNKNYEYYYYEDVRKVDYGTLLIDEKNTNCLITNFTAVSVLRFIRNLILNRTKLSFKTAEIKEKFFIDTKDNTAESVNPTGTLRDYKIHRRFKINLNNNRSLININKKLPTILKGFYTLKYNKLFNILPYSTKLEPIAYINSINCHTIYKTIPEASYVKTYYCDIGLIKDLHYTILLDDRITFLCEFSAIIDYFIPDLEEFFNDTKNLPIMKNKTVELLNHIKTLPSNMYFNINSNFFINQDFNIEKSIRVSKEEKKNFLSTNLLNKVKNLEIVYEKERPCIKYEGKYVCAITEDIEINLSVCEDTPSYNLMFEHFNILYPLKLIFAYTIICPITNITELPIFQNKDGTIKVYDFDNNIQKFNEFIDYNNSIYNR